MKPRVLIVDDDFSARIMLAIALRQQGFEVRTAATSDEALSLLRQEDFYWLVTDGKMQPMNGFDLAMEARKICSSIRIVMVSATFADRDIKGFPIEKVFLKPVAVDQLASWMRPSPSVSTNPS